MWSAPRVFHFLCQPYVFIRSLATPHPKNMFLCTYVFKNNNRKICSYVLMSLKTTIEKYVLMYLCLKNTDKENMYLCLNNNINKRISN